jgi:DNA replication protein DnaC
MRCPLCNDSGWKLVETAGSSAVTRCDCWRETLTEKLLTEARIPRRYQHCDFDTFLTYGNPSLEEALNRARGFVQQFPVVRKGLFFLGLPGVGKTHLAADILKRVVREKRGHGLFYDTRDLLRLIRETYDPIARTAERDVLRPVMEAELLVLDDLGAERTTEWVEETLNLIVNTRYSERRLTIFTSNYYDSEDVTDPDALQVRVGFRMYSRLHEMCDFIRLDGADFRKAPANVGEDELQDLWKARQGQMPSARGGAKLPARSSHQARVRAPRGSIDLKWGGGKAGT